MGPGFGSHSESEVHSIPSFYFINEKCSPPVFPHGEYYGYVATMGDDGPLLCGGYHSGAFQSSCYLLTRNGTWLEMHGMNNSRHFAAAVKIEAGWWVTGRWSVQCRIRHNLPSTIFSLSNQSTLIIFVPNESVIRWRHCWSISLSDSITVSHNSTVHHLLPGKLHILALI